MEVLLVTRMAPAQRREKSRNGGVGIAEGLILLAGLYLIMVPWILRYDGLVQLVLSNMVIGLALALLGVGHALAFDRLRGLSWVVPVLGLWVVLSPLATYHEGDTRPTMTIWLNNSITGGIALLAGLCVAAVAIRRGRELNA